MKGDMWGKINQELKKKQQQRFNDELKKEKDKAFKERTNKEEWDRMLKAGQRMDTPEPYQEPSENVEVPDENVDVPNENINVPSENVDVPEIETEVKDLPPEEENEKIMEVEHDPLEDFDENSVIPEPDEAISEEQSVTEEDIANAEEGEAPKKETDENDKDRTIVPGEEPPSKENTENKTEENKDGEKKEEGKTEADALREAQELAQHELPGFRVSKDWFDWTDKQKMDSIRNYMETHKVEDHRTYEDNKKINNFETYQRYPTALKVAEDAAKTIQTLGEGTKNVAKEVLGKGKTGMSISDAVDRSVPHYDYRSLFR